MDWGISKYLLKTFQSDLQLCITLETRQELNYSVRNWVEMFFFLTRVTYSDRDFKS